MFDFDEEKEPRKKISDKDAYIIETILRRKLQNARFQQKCEIKELAQCTGIHPNTISRSEKITGDSINLRTFIRMAEGLGMEVKLIPKQKDK